MLLRFDLTDLDYDDPNRERNLSKIRSTMKNHLSSLRKVFVELVYSTIPRAILGLISNLLTA